MARLEKLATSVRINGTPQDQHTNPALGHSLTYCALDRRGFDRSWVRARLQHTIISHEDLGIGINRQPVKQFP